MRKSLTLLACIGTLAFSVPAAAAPTNTGDIFAAIGNGQVAHYNHSGTLIETLNTGQGGYTTGMAFDGAGNLQVTNFSAGNTTRFNSNGVIVAPNPYVSPGSSPESIAYAQDGSFYVGRAGGSPQHYSSTGTLLQTYSTSGASDWIDLAADQTTLFYNDEGGTIRRLNVATNTPLADFANNTAHGGTNSYALRLLGNGDVISAAGSLITQYNAVGAFLGSYDVTGVDGFFALNLDPDGTHFWSGSFNNGTLYEFLIGGFGSNSSIASINTGSASLFGVALAGEITVGGPPTNGVPEPSTWAMMLLGFAGIGMAIRRRPRLAIA